MNAVAAGFGADVDDGIAGSGGLGVKDFVFADQTEGEGVDQRVAAVTGLEFGFAAQVGDAEAIGVGGDAADYAFDDGVVSANEFRLGGAGFGCGGIRVNRPEAQRIHDGEGASAHGEDVAQDAAHAGGRALKGLDVAGVVVALDLEGAGPAVADVDDAGVLAGALDDAVAFGGQALEMDAAGLVGAVLAPHDGVDAEFGEGGYAAQSRKDAAVLLRGDAVLGQQLRGYRNRRRNDCRGGGGHHGCLHCRTGLSCGGRGEGVERGGWCKMGRFGDAGAGRRWRACRGADGGMVVSGAAGKGCAILWEHRYPSGRDGGTGRRSGLKIRRPLRSWGFDPPSRHQQNKEFIGKMATRKRVAIFVWCLFWCMLCYSVPGRVWPVPAMRSTTDCRCSGDRWL